MPGSVAADPAALPDPIAATELVFTITGSNLASQGRFFIGGATPSGQQLPLGIDGRIAVSGSLTGTGNIDGSAGITTVPATGRFIEVPGQDGVPGMEGFGELYVCADGIGTGTLTVRLAERGQSLLGEIESIASGVLTIAAGQVGAGSPAVEIEVLFVPAELRFGANDIEILADGDAGGITLTPGNAIAWDGQNVRFDIPFSQFRGWENFHGAGGFANVTLSLAVTENRSLINQPPVVTVVRLGQAENATGAQEEELELGVNVLTLPTAFARTGLPATDRAGGGISGWPERTELNQASGLHYNSQNWSFLVSEIRFHN